VHVYKKTKEEGNWLYTVGYYYPHMIHDGSVDYRWVPLEDSSDEGEARALVNYLNGGMGYLFRYTK
jgi:hypothetical protein